jgi:hypothetical protein
VFPLQPRGKKPHPGLPDRPEGEGGYKFGTADPDRVASWWSRWPDANIGLACEPSGLVALDVDGDAGLRSLAGHPGPVPATTLSVTGRKDGGGHLIYAVPANARPRRSAAGVDGWAGLDVRSNGYIVLPPSVHPSGRVYGWDVGPDRLPPQPAPAWLLAAPDPPPRAVRRAPVAVGGAPGTRYGVRALRGLLTELAEARNGTRHATLYRVAVRVAELAAKGHLNPGEARLRLVLAAGVAWEGEDASGEIERTITDAWRKAGAS